MSFYKAAIGWDVPAVDLVLIVPQPASTGVEVTARRYSGNRTIYNSAPFIILRWNIVNGAAGMDDVLSWFGLDGADYTTNVTISVPQRPIFAYNRFNGIAHQPQFGEDVVWRESFPRNLEVLVTDLVLAA